MSRGKRGSQTWPVDLDATMRQIIAPWELPTLCDPKRRDAQVKYMTGSPRGYMGGGQPSVRIEKKGITQTTRIGPDLVPLMHGGKQVGLTTDQDVHLFPWRLVLERCAAMDPDTVEALRDCNARSQTHMASYRRFVPSPEAVGCGPAWRTPEEERTPAMKLYIAEHEKWTDEVSDPHYAKSAEIRAEQRRLFEACFTTNWFDSYDTGDLVLDLDLG